MPAVVLLLCCCCDAGQHGLPPPDHSPEYARSWRGGAAYDRSALLQRADHLRKAENRPAEALALYREVLRQEQGRDVDALGGAAAILVTRRSTLPEARELLEQARQLAPTDARAAHALGVAEWAATRNATASAALTALTHRRPSTSSRAEASDP